MDSLLLLCRVDAFLVRGSGMFVHSVRGCVRDCADCNCVGSAKSLHSVDWEYIVPPVVNRSHDEETCSVDHKALGDKFHMKYGLQRVLCVLL
ncbi:unnamed protein product [Heligmosomoides polygyrus]|uniref:Secreted protein n=1 Tax=Heligmosomoides polygyrus TaxID=6339 RepID=A0A183F4E6_HELPZ|nr:unnamed protein product [Heligmosomoides polygyrus]